MTTEEEDVGSRAGGEASSEAARRPSENSRQRSRAGGEASSEAARRPSENSRQRSHSKDERRAQLLEAARAVFCDKGYHAATVDDITRAAGVAKGTYYLYFSEKRTVFYELIIRFFEMVTEAGMSVANAEVKTAEDFFTRLERAARRLARLFSENRDLVRLTYRESMGMDEKLEKMVRNFYRQMAQVEAENVRLGVKLGLFREDVHPLLAAYAHIGMVERVLLQWVSDRAFPEVPNLVHQLIELAYHGMQRADGAG